MSMSHKAFVFDTFGFHKKLSNIILDCATMDNNNLLELFIDENFNFLTSPYSYDFLDSDWRQDLETADIQELSDFAMTFFYEIEDERGCEYTWNAILETLKGFALLLKPEYYILGNALKTKNFALDPGKLGLGFIDAVHISTMHTELISLRDEIWNSYDQNVDKSKLLYEPSYTEFMEGYENLISIYEQAQKRGHGLLMTF